MMADPLPLPVVIPLALGAALGVADALGVLIQFAGQSPLLDIAICILAMGTATTYLLGAVLVARFVRPGPAAAGHGQGGGAQRAAAMELCLAKMTLAVSVGVAFLDAACLLVAPFVAASGSGRPHARSPFFPWWSHMVDTTPVGVAAAVAAAGAALLARFSRRARTGRGGAAPMPDTDARRFGKLTSLAVVVSAVAMYAYGAAGCYC